MLCFLLLGLAVIDAETMRLPDAFTLPGIGLGVVWSGLVLAAGRGIPGALFLRPNSVSLHACQGACIISSRFAPWLVGMIASAVWAFAAALVILAIRWSYLLVRHKEGMGLGDAKLLAMIAAWLGPALTLLTLFLGVVSAALVGLVWIVTRRRRSALRMRLPFGAFLCAAAIFSIFGGIQIVDWYLRFFP